MLYKKNHVFVNLLFIRYHDFKLSLKWKISLLSVLILLYVYSKKILSNRRSRPSVIFKTFGLKVSQSSQNRCFPKYLVKEHLKTSASTLIQNDAKQSAQNKFTGILNFPVTNFQLLTSFNFKFISEASPLSPWNYTLIRIFLARIVCQVLVNLKKLLIRVEEKMVIISLISTISKYWNCKTRKKVSIKFNFRKRIARNNISSLQLLLIP